MLDFEHAQLKHRTLIISECRSWMDRIGTLFSDSNWHAESMTAHSMFGQGASSAMDYRCVVFVIDHHFRKRFNGLITEMSALVRNASAHTPVYLLFENDDDAVFSTWLSHVKKTFTSATDRHSLHEAIQNIVCTES